MKRTGHRSSACSPMGLLLILLTACDGGLSSSDISTPPPPSPPPNFAPVCNAGDMQQVFCSQTPAAVPLDGTLSYDPEGVQLTFLWSSSCPGSIFDDPTSPTPILSIPCPGATIECQIELRVSDGQLDSACQVKLRVVPKGTWPLLPDTEDTVEPEPKDSLGDSLASARGAKQDALWIDVASLAAGAVLVVATDDCESPRVLCSGVLSLGGSFEIDPSVPGHACSAPKLCVRILRLWGGELQRIEIPLADLAPLRLNLDATGLITLTTRDGNEVRPALDRAPQNLNTSPIDRKSTVFWSIK